ncbi:MAG TPA: hypothetical protein VFB78_14260 [Acidimicrobiales bacterium]|nr:hypothetical protein [Acidimicrobiales bacterium]
MTTPVYLEVGTKKVFACAVDWPGWARSGKTEDEALAALADYAERYAPVPDLAKVKFAATHSFKVVTRVKGDTTTDFGAPHKWIAADNDHLSRAQAARMTKLVEASWKLFDKVVKGAPASLRKGPRGGGRDRDKMVDHVREAEKSYGAAMLLPPKERDRESIALALQTAVGEVNWKWPPRYAARRIAWHVLDHAWEIEDKSD